MRRTLACRRNLPLGLFSLYCAAAIPGCYHMYSQPYGYSGAPVGTPYPGTIDYGTPIQTLTPGQPYTPGQPIAPGTYQPVQPGGGYPTYQNGTLQPVPDNNNSAPQYNPNPGTTPNPNPQTPNPYFPNTSITPAPSAGMASIPPVSPLEPAPLHPPTASLREIRTQSGTYEPRMNGVTPVSAELAAPAPATALMPPTGAPPAQLEFAPPVMSPPPSTPDGFPSSETPGSGSMPWGIEANKVITSNQQTFAHDPRFQWLRGIATKAPHEAHWSITYNIDNKADDKWAGTLSLAPSPYLEQLKDGDVIEVHGHIDDVIRDQNGKPVYVVSSLKKPFETRN